MKYILSLTTAAALVTAVSSCGTSDSTPDPIHSQLIASATVVNGAADRPTCDAAQIDNLYYSRASNSYSTCVDQGGGIGYSYLDLNTAVSSYDGNEAVLGFTEYSALPTCGWQQKGLVVMIEATNELKYCGAKEGYRWWMGWRAVKIDANGMMYGCTVKDSGNGSRTVTCGDSSATVRDGRDGKDGVDGKRGPDGYKGPAGTPGPKGAKGDRGDRGRQGDKGRKGDKGARGDRGDKGAKGDRGEAGAAGKDGQDGAPGPRGDQGPQGDEGLPGSKGAKGDVGPKGDKGPKGEPGPQGPKGDSPKGDKGPQGEPGPRGETGAAGAKGPPGANGRNCSVFKSHEFENVYVIDCPGADRLYFKVPPSQ